MSEEIESKWEHVDNYLWRIKVEGGHIYQGTNGDNGVSNCFVPDVDLTRYQAHLRDAYSKGFEDGKADAHAQYVQCKKPS